MSDALTVINDAVDPKRFIVLRQKSDLIGWLKANYQQDPSEPKRFLFQSTLLGMRAKVWVTVYERSLWLRFVVLTGNVIGSPIWHIWEINPRLEASNHAKIIKVLDYVTREIKSMLASYPTEERSSYTELRFIRRVMDMRFEQANRMINEL